MPGEHGIRRVLLCALAALSVGLGAISLIAGFSTSVPIRALQVVAVFAAGAAILAALSALVLVRLGGWREPESEAEFERLVQRSEWLATVGEAEPEPDPEDEDDLAFRALVRAAVDELPLEFHRALEHVAIVVSEGGAEY